jgi:hypothetical protein
MQDTDTDGFTEAATSDGALSLAPGCYPTVLRWTFPDSGRITSKSEVILLKLALMEGIARFHTISTGNRM